MHDVLNAHYRTLLPGYGMQNPGNRPRRALLRLKDGRLLSGCGGDVEVLHPLELVRSQETGLPVRATTITIFRHSDIVRGMMQPASSDHVLVWGWRHAALVHSTELFEGTVVPTTRNFQLPANIVAIDAERHAKTELLLTFLLETGIFHYALSLEDGSSSFECLLAFKCTRTITSGILWRDGGALHVAYYDGFVRVGIVEEHYDDMLLVKRLAAQQQNLPALLEVLNAEVTRLSSFEDEERVRRKKMMAGLKQLQERFPSNGTQPPEEDLQTSYDEYIQLKTEFKSHTIRSDRVSHRLIALKKLLQLVVKAVDCVELMDKHIAALEKELEELAKLSQLHDQCLENGNQALISKSWSVVEERKWAVEDLVAQIKTTETTAILEEWTTKIHSIIDSLSGQSDAPKDMRQILTHSIFEHRPDRNDKFTHFLLDDKARDMTLYCMSGLSTLAIYPRKALRVASISLDASYETSLTSACLMTSPEGVYVADDRGVFPIYFNREKRYFDAGNPITIPPFDHITSILYEDSGMILGSVNGGLLHLAFDHQIKYDHAIIASSIMVNPFSCGPIFDLKVLAAGDTHLAIHGSNTEVAISEREHDRWHRVTSHTGGAIALAVTDFSLEHRGAFLVAASKTYARIKALQYTDDNLVGLHDLGESRALDEAGKPIEMLNISLDPTMEYRPLPCKLRYAIGFADKAIRTYVALLSGEHDFNVSEKFIAQIEPLHNVNQLICFHGRPMGCYTSNGKTLQVWNDLDRHQQKKMKSERMALHKMEAAICQLERVEGRSSYLLVSYKDNKVEVYEERGKGTGRLEKSAVIPEADGAANILRARCSVTGHGDRLYVHTLTSTSVLNIFTVLIEAGNMVQWDLAVSSNVSLYGATRIEPLLSKPYEFVVYGNGIHLHRLTEEERRQLDRFKDFEL